MEIQTKNFVALTSDFVKNSLEGAESGHNWYHIQRVLSNARKIFAKKVESDPDFASKASLENIELGALLHDISDYKFNNGDETMGAKIASEYLLKIGVPEEQVKKVTDIIDGVTFKGPKEKNNALCLESQIVQDADRLDALGAIGIARTFCYGGSKGREIYDPNEIPNTNMDWQQYKNNKSCSVSHFYEKLFFLKDIMNTEEAKKLAEERHNYMVEYVKRFKAEWEGTDY